MCLPRRGPDRVAKDSKFVLENSKASSKIRSPLTLKWAASCKLRLPFTSLVMVFLNSPLASLKFLNTSDAYTVINIHTYNSTPIHESMHRISEEMQDA